MQPGAYLTRLTLEVVSVARTVCMFLSCGHCTLVRKLCVRAVCSINGVNSLGLIYLEVCASRCSVRSYFVLFLFCLFGGGLLGREALRSHGRSAIIKLSVPGREGMGRRDSHCSCMSPLGGGEGAFPSRWHEGEHQRSTVLRQLWTKTEATDFFSFFFCHFSPPGKG